MNMIKVDFAQKTHAPKPVHGVNNGPICHLGITDLSRHYKAMNIPSVRLHDTDGANSRFLVDISRIFPDFDADENDERNYFFAPTDRLLKAIHALGAETVYRLGESIDHDRDTGWFARPPKDFDKWVRICINVIRHYNDGWANGYHLDIKYWEIWNEGECVNERNIRCEWRDGTIEQLFDLYKRAVLGIKAYNPALYVGGMAFCNCNQELRDFIEFCRSNELPLDFLSYHGYYKYISDIAEAAQTVRNKLDACGFKETKMIYDEWNYVGFERDVPGDVWTLMRNDDTPELCQEVYDNQKNEVGGAYTAAVLIKMNDLPIDMAHYYDGQTISGFCGLFNNCAVPQKPYYSFKAYGDIYANCDSLVKAECEEPDYYALAAEGKNFKGILISSFRGNGDYIGVDMKNLGGGRKKAEIYITDESNNMLLDRVEYFVGDEVCQTLKIKKYAVAYIKVYDILAE